MSLTKAANNADWDQVLMNGGPPCFHLEGEWFCLRAKRWYGHDEIHHQFVSFGDLIKRLESERDALQKESACPVCRGGKNLEGEDVCSECKGTGLASVAYDVCRTHWKLMREERDALKLQLQLDSDRNLCEAAIRGKGASEHSLAEVLKERK